MLERALKKSIALVPWRWRGIVKNLPLVAPLQRWLLARFLYGHEFVHTVDRGPAAGLRYPIMLPQDKGIWTGTYELDFAKRVSEAVRLGDVCLDIGGWRGFFGGVMALAGARRVIVFEPFPDNGTQIRRMIALNPGLPLELVMAAVGAENGTAKFHVMHQSSMGKLATSSFQPAAHGDKSLEVPIITLDGLLEIREIEVPSAIKIDVEGAELLVLQGARNLLAAHRPQLFIEIHSRTLASECYTLLRNLDYSVSVLETGRVPDFVAEPEICHFLGKVGVPC